MKIIILGCGPSYGIPTVRTGFGYCDPNNPKNIRSRSCLYLEENGTSVLFDTPPELRLQLYKNHIEQLDAIVFTHMHADHTMGIDDARIFTFNDADRHNVLSLPVFVNELDEAEFRERFGFYLKPMNYLGQTKSVFDLSTVKAGTPFKIQNLTLLPIAQDHGNTQTLGFRVGDFLYTTDLKDFIDTDLSQFKGVKLWILGCVTTHENNKHIYLDKAIEWFNIVKPERMILTHLGAKMDYDTITALLPKGMELAYDGMQISL
ncbi:MAG: MBL fold metallo-hydrolase [Alphaproteobacteria bacterium]